MEENTFKRQLGIIGGISLAAGSTIGSGIFTNPTLVLGYTGSVGASLLIWAACGVNAILCGFSYLEVALLIRQSGGTYGKSRLIFININTVLSKHIGTRRLDLSLHILSAGFGRSSTALLD